MPAIGIWLPKMSERVIEGVMYEVGNKVLIILTREQGTVIETKPPTDEGKTIKVKTLATEDWYFPSELQKID